MNKIISIANSVLKNTKLAKMSNIPTKNPNGSTFPTLRDIFNSSKTISAEGLWMFRNELYLFQEETSTPLDLEIQRVAESTNNNHLSLMMTVADKENAPPAVASQHIMHPLLQSISQVSRCTSGGSSYLHSPPSVSLPSQR